jgi:hypothetical protein
MSTITWQTPAGNLGTVPENDSFEKTLSAIDSSSNTIFYRLLSGDLPLGMQITADGKIQGVPGISSSLTGNDINFNYTFVVRASTADGAVADRTFSITVSALIVPVLQPESQNLGSIFDGVYYALQFSALDTSASTLTFSLNSGSIPPGLTLSTNGLLSGIPIKQFIDDPESRPNYDKQRYDRFAYDFTQKGRIQNYAFTVRVDDGVNFNVKPYQITVFSKSLYTADNAVETVDIGDLDVSYDNQYAPVMTTLPGIIGTVRQGQNFNFQFESYDGEESQVYYTLTSADDTAWGGTIQEESGFDLFGVVGFDSVYFDQGEQSLPGLRLNYETGWLSGQVDSISETFKDYDFKVTPYKYNDNGDLIYGNGVYYSIRILGDLYNSVDWQTDSDLGIVREGESSTLQLEATATTGIGITYSLALDYPQALPQGLRLTADGLLIGRPTFRRFVVDADSTLLTVVDSTGILVGMDVVGPGVGTGAKVTEVTDIHNIIVSPAVIAASGTAITFYNNTKTIVLVLSQPSQTTTITDYVNGVENTTFDAVKEFTVRATTLDASRSGVRTFSLTIDNYNLAPYDNLYLKAFPKLEQRTYLNSILDNSSIFPDDMIYRRTDPWFGKSKDIKALILPGIVPSNLNEYVSAMVNNHYNKKIKFGNVKTARAVDENFNTKYEVVYVELVDNQINNNRSVAKEQVDLSLVVNNYFNDDPINRYLYPNSFKNMRNRIGGTLGFENRGALPDWMTSPQEDGRVIGFTHAAVLAYTKPNKANIIKYRLEQSGFNFNVIDFEADRYQLDNILSANYDKIENKFLSSAETTFDVVPRASRIAGGVDFAVSVPFNQINQRTVGYINSVLGGIDGYTNFEDGMTLVFAQQEDYLNNTSPFDGWIRNFDNFENSGGFDSVGMDQYETIPGYLDEQVGRAANQRSGIWTIKIDANNLVTLEFTQSIAVSEQIRVANGASYSGSVLVYDPVLSVAQSVPAYRSLTRNNNDSTSRTTFDGNGTKFLNYRDVYTNPEVGDKYIKFPQIGVFA